MLLLPSPGRPLSKVMALAAVATALASVPMQAQSPSPSVAPSSPAPAAVAAPSAVPAFTWTEVTGLKGLGDDMLIEVAARSPDGTIVLGGVRRRELKNGGLRIEHATWASDDGVTWERSKLKGADGIRAIAGGDAGFVAIDGSSGDRVWVSEDGRRWTVVRLPKDRRGRIEAVIATPDGFVVTGGLDERRSTGRNQWTDDQRPAVLSSADGRTWEATRFEGYGVLHAVTAAPDGTLLALGNQAPAFDGPYKTAAWQQDATGAWVGVEAPDRSTDFIRLGTAAGRTYGLDRFGGRLLVRAEDGSWEEPVQASVSGVVPLADGVAVALDALRGQLFWSTDWATWSEEPIGDLGEGLVRAGLHLADGRVLVVTHERPDPSKATERSRVWIGEPAG